MPREEQNKLNYIITLVAEFAAKYMISERQAYNYLVRFSGMSHLQEFYKVLHTQTLDSAVETMTEVCQHHGGQLK